MFRCFLTLVILPVLLLAGCATAAKKQPAVTESWLAKWNRTAEHLMEPGIFLQNSLFKGFRIGVLRISAAGTAQFSAYEADNQVPLPWVSNAASSITK